MWEFIGASNSVSDKPNSKSQTSFLATTKPFFSAWHVLSSAGTYGAPHMAINVLYKWNIAYRYRYVRLWWQPKAKWKAALLKHNHILAFIVAISPRNDPLSL